MAILVDTNVIADVLYNDPVWGDWSSEQLARHFDPLLINPLIYAELCYGASAPEDVSAIMTQLGWAMRSCRWHRCSSPRRRIACTASAAVQRQRLCLIFLSGHTPRPAA